MCMATESPEVTCNLLDDDCDRQVDNVDVGGDGICDCLRIGVMGNPGANPSANFQAWLESRGTTTMRFGLDNAPLTLADLTPFDVVILDRLVREYTADEANILRTFVEGGGGVMVMTGHDGGDDLPRDNSLLSAFGLAYQPGLLNGPVEQWEPHEISTGITSVTFRGGYHVIATDATPNMPIARLADGLVGIAQERGMGRIFAFGDEWIEFDTEWSTMPMIARLWANVLAWLGPRDRCDVLF
jgi:hypothetical protein